MRNLTRKLLPVACVLACISPAWAGKLLVLDSDPPNLFRKGSTFDGGREVAVPDNGRLVLMDERGQAVTIKGPYTGIPGGGESSQGPTFLQRLAAVLQPSSDESRPVLGATRALVPPPPDEWAIDVAANGPVCAKGAASLVLWRATPKRAATLILSAPGGTPIKQAWPAGSATLPWPTDIPIADARTYHVQTDPTAAPTTITLRIAPASMTDEAALLDWMASNRCDGQVKAMLAEAGKRRVVDGATASGKAVFE